MASEVDTIDKLEKYVTGTITKPLENILALDATVSIDWLPDTYTITDGKLLVEAGVDYDLGLLLVGKVPSETTDAKRLYHTYSETKPDSELPGWLSAADPYFEDRGETVPQTAILGYTIAKTIDLKALWPQDDVELANTTVALYEDDIEIDSAKYIVTTDGLWWVSETYDDLPLDIYVAAQAPVFSISITKTAAEGDVLPGANAVDTNLVNPVEGTDALSLDVLSTGVDECGGVPRTISLFARQKSTIRLYPFDTNGNIIDLEDTGYNVIFTMQESRADAGVDATFDCTRNGTEDEFTVDFIYNEPGMYIGRLMIFDSTDNTLLYVTNYYVSIAPSGDYSGVVTIPEIRYHLADTCAQENELLDAFEYSDSDIINAIHNCVEYFNGMLGGVGEKYSPKNFPADGRYFLKQGVAAFLLRTKAIILARNTIRYNAGGVSIDDQNKAEVYMKLAAVFHKDWAMYCGRRQNRNSMRRSFKIMN